MARYNMGGALSSFANIDDLEPLTTPYQKLRMGISPSEDSPFFSAEEWLAKRQAPELYRNLADEGDGNTRAVTHDLVDQLLRARNARSINETRGSDKLMSPDVFDERNRIAQGPSFTEKLSMDYLPRSALFLGDMMRPQEFSDAMMKAEDNWKEGNYGAAAAYLGLAPINMGVDIAGTAILPAALEKGLATGAARWLSGASSRADDVLRSSRTAAAAAKASPLVAGGAIMAPDDAEAGSNPKWFSALRQAIENAPQEKMTLPQWMGYLKNRPGIKAEEMDYVFGGKAKDGGIFDLDIGKEPVTRKGMLEEFDKNDVPVDELYRGNPLTREERTTLYNDLKGGAEQGTLTRAQRDQLHRLVGKEQVESAGAPKYEDSPSARLLGKSEDYREIIVTSPRAEFDDSVPTSHFGPGATAPGSRSGKDSRAGQQIGWLRGDVRELDDGSRAFHVDEFQSDPAQRALTKGRKNPANEEKIKALDVRAKALDDELEALGIRGVDDYNKAYNNPEHPQHALVKELHQLSTQVSALKDASRSGVPDRPWKKDWPKLLFRRALWEAAQEDADHLTWTTADTQAQRWGGARIGRDRLYEEQMPKIAAEEAKRLGLTPDAVGQPSVAGTSKWGPEMEEEFMDAIDPDATPSEVSSQLYEFLKGRGVDVSQHLRSIAGIENFGPGDAPFEAQLLAQKILQSEVAPGKTKLHSLKLTPEVRKRIIEEGLPKFVGAGVAPGLVERFFADEPGDL